MLPKETKHEYHSTLIDNASSGLVINALDASKRGIRLTFYLNISSSYQDYIRYRNKNVTLVNFYAESLFYGRKNLIELLQFYLCLSDYNHFV